LVDGKDWLGPDHIGLDPPEFFEQFGSGQPTRLTIGRCNCGIVGCSSIVVEVDFGDDSVVWETTNLRQARRVKFNRSDYEKELARAAEDFSWEDEKRRVERLVTPQLADLSTDDGLTFRWASARFAPNVISVAFENAGVQRLFEFTWDGSTIESAVVAAKTFASGFHGKKV
jgi:hypothetical protein